MKVLARSIEDLLFLEWDYIDVEGEPIAVSKEEEDRPSITRKDLKMWKEEAHDLYVARDFQSALDEAYYIARGKYLKDMGVEEEEADEWWPDWEGIEEYIPEVIQIALKMYNDMREAFRDLLRERPGFADAFEGRTAEEKAEIVIWDYFLRDLIQELREIPHNIDEINPEEYPHVYMLSRITGINYYKFPIWSDIPFIVDPDREIEICQEELEMALIRDNEPEIVEFTPDDIPDILDAWYWVNWKPEDLFRKIIKDAMQNPQIYAEKFPEILERVDEYTDFVTAVAIAIWDYLQEREKKELLNILYEEDELEELFEKKPKCVILDSWLIYTGYDPVCFLSLEWRKIRKEEEELIEIAEKVESSLLSTFYRDGYSPDDFHSLLTTLDLDDDTKRELLEKYTHFFFSKLEEEEGAEEIEI